ncbi:MAG: hypothetical protein COS95_07690 [Ignavibacteriales bacterium CG07_land_8_20_14_0_80_59_12]|nr:MAG: hypothetical protein COS95_07690 [Ignavibacteriales bacterium CG07_land_8_20_14_0_80_59_12]
MKADVVVCESCGFPMRSPKDHGASDPTVPRCVYCTNADGSFKLYHEVFELTVEAFMERKGLKRRDAERSAHSFIDNLPAWKGRPQ